MKNIKQKIFSSKDTNKLEEALDNLMNVQKESVFAIFHENVEDLEPFLLKLIKDSLDVLISNYADKDLERAIFYGLVEEVQNGK